MSVSAFGRLLRNPLARRKAVRFYSLFIRKGDLCYDIGANRGDRTDAFLALGARVLCVEPQLSCLRILKDKFSRYKNVTIVPQAVGEREGTGELAICDDAPAISTMSVRWRSEGRFAKDHRWESLQEVPVTTMDALIAEHGTPRFLKVDVEGWELAVFKGLTRPIPYISFEFTNEFLDTARECIETLKRIGRLHLNASFGEAMKLSFPDWYSPEQFWMAMTPRLDKQAWGDIIVMFDYFRNDPQGRR